MRIYVLVLSYRPLRVFVYRRGFARFCTFDYTNDVSELDNDMVHLTNVALRKCGGPSPAHVHDGSRARPSGGHPKALWRDRRLARVEVVAAELAVVHRGDERAGGGRGGQPAAIQPEIAHSPERCSR